MKPVKDVLDPHYSLKIQFGSQNLAKMIGDEAWMKVWAGLFRACHAKIYSQLAMPIHDEIS